MTIPEIKQKWRNVFRKYRLEEKNRLADNHSFLIEKFCGELIAHGSDRSVYEYAFDNRYVVKLEPLYNFKFSNAREYRNYEESIEYGLDISEWLAPCVLINASGIFMIQRKVKHKSLELYPKIIPSCFTDIKGENFGFIGNKFVCHDYPLLIPAKREFQKIRKWKMNHDE